MNHTYESTYNSNWLETTQFNNNILRFIQNSSASSSVSGIGSGIANSSNYLLFGVVDIYGRIISSDDTSTLTLTPSCPSSTREFVSNVTTVSAINGIYNFSNFVFQFDVGYANCNLSKHSSIISTTNREY